jgi:hypothetical protein
MSEPLETTTSVVPEVDAPVDTVNSPLHPIEGDFPKFAELYPACACCCCISSIWVSENTINPSDLNKFKFINIDKNS